MKAFKGFNEKLQCNPNGEPFQYEIGKEYEHEGDVKPCRSGFHACKSPLDVLGYYPPNTSRYCKVFGIAKSKTGKQLLLTVKKSKRTHGTS